MKLKNKYRSDSLFFLFALFIFAIPNITFANHSNGLHLQLPNKILDIQKSDIEEFQMFQVNPQTASVMLKLKPATADKLYKLTENLIGQPIVWIWNGRVISMETLKSPINNVVTVNNFTVFEAEDFKNKT